MWISIRQPSLPRTMSGAQEVIMVGNAANYQRQQPIDEGVKSGTTPAVLVWLNW